MTATLTAARSRCRPRPGSGSRKVKNNARDRRWSALAFGIALVPLVWLLWTVISKGWQRDHRAPAGGPATSAASTFSDPGGGALARDHRHARAGRALRGHLGADRGPGRASTSSSTAAAGSPGSPRSWSTSSPASRRSSRRCSSTRVFVTTFGGQFAGVCASLALVLLMIPVIVRTTEEMLKLVPNELREASYALGVPKWKTIVQDRPADRVHRHRHRRRARHRPGRRRDRAAADPGRVHAEHRTTNLFTGFQAALPLMINDQVERNLGSGSYQPRRERQPGRRSHNFAPDRMWGAALTLIIIVMVLNLIARLIGRFSKVAN